MGLCDLKINQVAIIKKINLSKKNKRRLYDLGFTEGAKVMLYLVSPSKLIKAYLIRNSLIAIRDKDALKIEVGVVNG